jgi:hypothetical protein
MRLSKLLVALAVAVGAFALFGANARVAMADGGPVISPSNSLGYTVHLDDGTTLPGVFCDTNPLCQEVTFKSSVAGTLTATATYDASQIVGVFVCQVGTGDVITNGNCPDGQTEIQCSITPAFNADGTETDTVMCPIGANISYALLLVAEGVFTCPLSDIDFTSPSGCKSIPPGIDVTGTISVSAFGTASVPTNNFGKVRGNGDVASLHDADFQIIGFAKPDKVPKGHVRYIDKDQRCRFYSKDITNVIVMPGMSGGGDAEVDGDGYVINSAGVKSFVSTFTAKAHDSGQKTTMDQFQLTAAGCSTTNSNLTKGDVKITPTDDGMDG